MAVNFRRFYNGIQIKVVTSATADTLGELEVFGTKVQYFNGTSVSPIVTETHASQGANRLTNKDLEAASTKVVDASDTTKKVAFSASGATTGTATTLTFAQTTARAITFPDATDTLVGKATTDSLTNKTLVDTSTAIADSGDATKQIKFDAGGTTGTSTTITAAQTANRVITLPDATTTVVGTDTTQTLTNKTLTSPTINTPTLTVLDTGLSIQDDGDNTKIAKFQASGITTGTTRTFTFPDANTTIVGTDATQTLTNKTLNGNTATNLVSGSGTFTFNTTGTITAPNATDTLVGKATTDVLTNKTITGNTAVNLVSGSGTTIFNTTGTVTLPNATDTLVGKATTDALTNKDYQGGTATNTSRITVPGATKSTLDALTRKAATIVYGTDTTKLYVDNGTSLTPVGSASTYNLLTFDTTWNAVNTDNSDFENTIGSWVTYNDSSQVPVDLTGGSATNLTISRTTTAGEVLDGTASLKVVKTANNSQGQGLSCVFNVPPAYQGKLIQISIPYRASTGSLASGDLYAYIYDVTNSILISPINNAFINGTLGTLTAVFSTQNPAATPANIQMRVGIHFASTSAVAQTIEFDDIIIAPTYQATAGASVGDWNTSVGITASAGFGTITNSNIYTRRVGDSLQVRGYFTTGTTAASAAFLQLPSGYAIDTTKFGTGGNASTIGYWAMANAVSQAIYSNNVAGVVFYDGSTSNQLFFTFHEGASSGQFTKDNGSAAFSNTATVSFEFTVPISGWVSTGTPIGMIATDEASNPITPSAGFGTTTLQSTWSSRIGDKARFRGYFKCGTVAASNNFLGLPSGYVIDNTKFATTSQVQHVGYWYRIKTAGSANFGTSDNFGNLFYDGSDTANIYLTRSSGSNIFNKETNILGDNDAVSYEFTVPIKNWATNGQVVVPFPRSEIWLYNSSGYGSSNTTVRRWTTVGKNTGLDLTLTQDSTNGDKIVVNSDGLYCISYSDQFSGSGTAGISVNGTQLTTSIASITAADRRSAGSSSGANRTAIGCPGMVLFLSSGDTIRCQTDTSASGTSTYESHWRVTKVSN